MSTFLAQGTIYPDVIESGAGECSRRSRAHHNVGGLPDHVDFQEIIEPLRDAVSRTRCGSWAGSWACRQELVMRQPFPGPGLAIRVMGEVT